MITEEEYLRAKKIVEEYERLEYELKSAEAHYALHDDEEDDFYCESCGQIHDFCTCDPDRAYNNPCDPFQNLLRDGYD